MSKTPEKLRDMKLIKRMSYIEIDGGYRTYLFTSDYQPIPHHFFSTLEELELSVAKAKESGWKVTNATKLLNRLRQQSRRK